MIDWQIILSLLIVTVAVIQLSRLLFGKKSNCGSCSGTCPTSQNDSIDLVELDDITGKK